MGYRQIQKLFFLNGEENKKTKKSKTENKTKKFNTTKTKKL